MGKGLHEILGGAEQARVMAKEAERQAQDAAAAEILEMQRRILAGEGGTGNALHDGIIALYGNWVSASVVENYESVATRLETVPLYDPAVVISRRLEQAEFDTRHEPRHLLRNNIVMGTINGRSLNFDLEKKKVFLPTAQCAYNPRGDNYEPKQGELLIDEPFSVWRGSPELGRDLDRELDMNSPMFFEPRKKGPILAMEVLIGRNDINEWLKAAGEYSMDRNYELAVMRRLAKALQIQPIEPATKWQREFLQRS